MYFNGFIVGKSFEFKVSSVETCLNLHLPSEHDFVQFDIYSINGAQVSATTSRNELVQLVKIDQPGVYIVTGIRKSGHLTTRKVIKL